MRTVALDEVITSTGSRKEGSQGSYDSRNQRPKLF